MEITSALLVDVANVYVSIVVIAIHSTSRETLTDTTSCDVSIAL